MNRISKIIALAATTLIWSQAAAENKEPAKPKESHDFQISKNLDIFNSVYKELDLFYVDTIQPEKTVKRGIDAMLATADPYTTYFPESEMKDLKFMTTGSYAGVGAIISTKEKKVYITEIYEGKPAYKAGLRAGDVFVSVGGEETDGKTTSDVSEMLRGEPQTTVKVVVNRPGKGTLRFDVVREKIVIDPVVYHSMLNSQVGYINLTQFTDQSYSSFHNAYLALKAKGMKQLVIDMRSNPGGLLSEACRIVNMFVPKGSKIVYTKGKEKKWNSTYWAKEAPLDTVMPIAVLVNRNSASAAEIVSGALQDLDRAVIIGERTYGKGLVQTTRDLPYGGSLKVTISKYYIPSGRCIQAIDYAQRDKDGFVARIPDSLTHEFKTAHGRIVRDGCGISPDVFMKTEKNATITYQLYAKNLFFEYATHYRQQHPQLPSVATFKLTDADYRDFKDFVKKQGFEYKNKAEENLEKIRKTAEEEGYLDGAKAEFDALQQRLKANLDADLDKNREDISQFICLEIVRLYHYQRGVAQESLKGDKWTAKALEILGDSNTYNTYLTKERVGDPEAEKEQEKAEETDLADEEGEAE